MSNDTVSHDPSEACPKCGSGNWVIDEGDLPISLSTT
jgi:hypothetical protein